MKKINQREAVEAVKNREEFRAGALSAFKGTAPSIGDLPADIRDTYEQAAKQGKVTYTVLSYRTPIMWETTDGTIHLPARRYSLTTSNHQHLVRLALYDRRDEWQTHGPGRRAVPAGYYGRRAGW